MLDHRHQQKEAGIVKPGALPLPRIFGNKSKLKEGNMQNINTKNEIFYHNTLQKSAKIVLMGFSS